MATAAAKKMELINKIAKLPEQKIAEVDGFIQKLLAQLEFQKPVPISLKGIWKNKGFEKIADLETEIKDIRRELDDSILKRAF
ncbi:MAG: hypothetical protein ONB27_09735 [candidate division KSB1 bacterium]|nr:hypothetical protein [candidate division KSB1 bacterium]